VPRPLSAAAVAATLALAMPGAVNARKPPTDRVVTQAVPLPATITKAQFPNYTADGSRILAAARSSEFEGTQLVSFTSSGSDLRCLTCGHWTGPAMQKMFPLPDGRRILVRIGAQSATVAAAHGIVECSPSVLDCRDVTVVPIEAPFADDPNVVQTQREFRISPDGEHVLLTQIRTTHGGLIEGVGIVGKLVRGPDAYRVEDARVVATGGELKNFTPDGQGVLLARFNGAAEAGNPDDVRIDLRTGRETRVTYSPDWEEDIDIAAQRYRRQSWMVVGSARGTGLLETVSQIRRPLAITPAISGLPFRVFTLRNPEIAEPWINSLSAEHDGTLGQPLAPGAVAAGWNSRPNFSWKPDGTAVVYWQERIGETDNTRVVVSSLPDRRPQQPPEVKPIQAPAWAPPLQGYVPPDPSPPTSRKGKVSGRLDVELEAAPPGSIYQRFIRVRYTNFADQRGFVINGAESGYYDVAGLFGADSLYSADLVLSGRHSGYLSATTVAINVASIEGTFESELDGRHLTLGPLP
jgi:hypothetical protein